MEKKRRGGGVERGSSAQSLDKTWSPISSHWIAFWWMMQAFSRLFRSRATDYRVWTVLCLSGLIKLFFRLDISLLAINVKRLHESVWHAKRSMIAICARQRSTDSQHAFGSYCVFNMHFFIFSPSLLNSLRFCFLFFMCPFLGQRWDWMTFAYSDINTNEKK